MDYKGPPGRDGGNGLHPVGVVLGGLRRGAGVAAAKDVGMPVGETFWARAALARVINTLYKYCLLVKHCY